MPERDEPITLHICGAKCDAGGPDERGGHVWDRRVEIRDEQGRVCGDSVACRCGMSAMDFDLMHAP